MNHSFEFLIARSPKSVIWIGLYLLQVEIFETLTRYNEETTDSFRGYIEGRKGLTSKLHSLFEQEAGNFVKSITPKSSKILQSSRSTAALDFNRPTVIDRLAHLNLSESDDTFDVSGHRRKNRPRTRPSTAEELNELLSEMPQAEIWDIGDYDIKCLLQGVRIPRCHNAEDSLSLVIDAKRTGLEC